MHPQQQQAPASPAIEQTQDNNGSSGERSGLLTLHYGKHHASLVGEIRTWYQLECFADVVLICEGGHLKAHRLVLASASPLLRELLLGGSCPSSSAPLADAVLVHLPGVQRDDVAHLLEFLYTGEACLRASEVERLQELVTLLGIDSELWDRRSASEINQDEFNIKEEPIEEIATSEDEQCSDDASSPEHSRLNNPVNLSLNLNRRSSPPPRNVRRRRNSDVTSTPRSPSSAPTPSAPASAALPANGDSASQDRDRSLVRIFCFCNFVVISLTP
jgi:hypothetical protein